MPGDNTNSTAAPIGGGTAAPIGRGTAAPTGAGGTAAPVGQSGTAAPLGTPSNATEDKRIKYRDSYTLDGVTYTIVKVLSSTSGEAKIFLAKNKGEYYVVKLYKPRRHPDHNVLQSIQSTRGNGLIADVFSHGIWKDPDDQSISLDFEVMRYYGGGGLDSLKLRGNETKLRQVALRMAAAIDFCHRHNILHRDIKPANFLYTDSRREDFVLADFGIAKKIDKNGRCKIDTGRTPIYAAPECYISIDKELIDVDTKCDFYALGMSLLALWTGEGVLTGKERELIMLKQNESLPYPTDMSGHMLSLIKALTRRDVNRRAGFDEITRWAKGETIFKEEQRRPIGDFEIVFSATDNLIAHSPAELGQIMWSHKDLAKRYLYSGMIERWFNEIKRPELAIEMERITEKLHPRNQEAGLYAACLKLDGDMPFFGLKGEKLVTPKQIADELWANTKHYKSVLSDPEHMLWIYFNSCGLGEYSSRFPALVKKDSDQYVFQLMYLLDPKLPFPLKSLDDKWHNLYSVADVLKLARDKGLTDSSLRFILKEDFITWLSARDKALGGKVAQVIRQTSNGWAVLYALDPAADYFFETDSKATNYCLTPDKIADRVSREIFNPTHNGKDLISQLDSGSFKDSRLWHYLNSKGKYQKYIDYAQSTLDMASTENKTKAGPYSLQIARFKILKAFGGSCPYILKTGKVLKTLKDFEAQTRSVVDAECSSRGTLLADWISIFFQESPTADFKRHSRIDLTVDYLDYIKARLPKCSYVERSDKLADSIQAAMSAERNAWRSVTTIKVLVTLLCFVPMMLTFVVLLLTGFNDIGPALQPLLDKCAGVIGIIVAIIIGLATIGDAGLIGAVIVGAIGYGAVVLIFKFLGFLAPWLIAALVLFAIIYFARKIFSKTNKISMAGLKHSDLADTIRLRIVGEAFGTTHRIFKDMNRYEIDYYPSSMLTASASEAKGIRKKLLKNALGIIVVSVAVIAFNIFVTPTLLDPDKLSSYQSEESTLSDDEKFFIDNMAGTEWSGIFDSRNSTLSDLEYDHASATCTGTITVEYGNPMTQSVEINPDAANHAIEMLVFHSTGATGGTYEATFTEDYNGMYGTYTNPTTGRSIKFSFTKSGASAAND